MALLIAHLPPVERVYDGSVNSPFPSRGKSLLCKLGYAGVGVRERWTQTIPYNHRDRAQGILS